MIIGNNCIRSNQSFFLSLPVHLTVGNNNNSLGSNLNWSLMILSSAGIKRRLKNIILHYQFVFRSNKSLVDRRSTECGYTDSRTLATTRRILLQFRHTPHCSPSPSPSAAKSLLPKSVRWNSCFPDTLNSFNEGFFYSPACPLALRGQADTSRVFKSMTVNNKKNVVANNRWFFWICPS